MSESVDGKDLRVAVLGMGTMGAAMARSLLRAGFTVSVWNRSPERMQPLADAGARASSTPADAVRDADVVLTMLFDADAVLAVAAAFLPALRPGAVWMQSSTIGADGTRAAAAAASSNHIQLVDAPVLGTKDPAEHAQLTVLASGEEKAVAVLRPIFDAVGSRTVLVGERLGDASNLKLVANTWVASLTAGVAQSIALARAVDLDPMLFIRALSGTASDSPYAHVKGATILDDNRAPQFALDALLKDLRLAQLAARSSGATRYLDDLEAIYAAASETGHGNEDVAWVYDALQLPVLEAR